MSSNCFRPDVTVVSECPRLSPSVSGLGNWALDTARSEAEGRCMASSSSHRVQFVSAVRGGLSGAEGPTAPAHLGVSMVPSARRHHAGDPAVRRAPTAPELIRT